MRLRIVLAGAILSVSAMTTAVLAEGGNDLYSGASELRMAASSALKTERKAKNNAGEVNSVKLDLQDNSTTTVNAKTFDLFSAVKKIFFGIISALGGDKNEGGRNG